QAWHRLSHGAELDRDLRQPVQLGHQLEKVSTLGWTKLAVIAPVVTNENVDEWVGLAQEQNTLTLIETVKKSKQKDKTGEVTDGSAKTVTTMAFKVHEDQKATIDAAL